MPCTHKNPLASCLLCLDGSHTTMTSAERCSVVAYSDEGITWWSILALLVVFCCGRRGKKISAAGETTGRDKDGVQCGGRKIRKEIAVSAHMGPMA